MKRKLFYSLLTILILSGTRSFAQNKLPEAPAFNMTAEYTKLIPNSPETSALGKYGIIPVSLYDGIPNISIPIYEIHWGSLTLPISISYHNNGLKPSEDASKVGLGWCLNAGGVITRVVCGSVDESPNSSRFDAFPNLGDFENDQDILDSIANGRIDGEPDVYIFNFNGHTGKFLYINGKAHFTSQEDLKISKNGDDFQIITEDGTIYDFTAKDVTAFHHIFQSEISVPQHYSAWSLSKITSKDKKDVITLEYNTSPYTHADITIDQYKESCTDGMAPRGSYGTYPVHPTATTTQELSLINFGDNSVQFIPDSRNRLDILSNRQALKSIQVNASSIKKFNFIYGYFDENSKLKLSEIQQVDGMDGSLLNKYMFSYYNEDASFPDQNTRGIDGWGYYNGANFNHTLISNTINSLLPQNEPGNRTPDFSSAQKGVLKTITYPTGGTTSFEYEPNMYGGSLEYVYIDKYAFCETVFSYSNNGDPETTSENFTLKERQQVNIYYARDSPDLQEYGIAVSPYPILKIKKGSTVYYSRSINYRADHGSDVLTLDPGTYTMIVGCEENETQTWANITYKELTQQVSPGTQGPGIRIHSITSDDKISNKKIIKNYSYKNDNGTGSGILLFYPECLSLMTEWQKREGCEITCGNDFRYDSDIRSGLGSMLDYDFYYSKVTETIADGISTGKTVTDFSVLNEGNQTNVIIAPSKEVQWKTTDLGDFKKAKETHYSYEVFPFPPVFGFKSVLAKASFLLGFCTQDGGIPTLLTFPPYDRTDQLDTLPRYNLYAPKAVNNVYGYYRLKSEDNILYSDIQNDSIITKRDYFYDNKKYSMPSKIIEFNSKGEKLMTRSKYPYNYLILSPSVLTPDQAEDVYYSTIDNIRENFEFERYDATTRCLPAFPNYWDDTEFKARVKANSAYKSNYFNAYRQAITTRDNSLTTYNNSLANAISLSTDPTQKALLIMQRDHMMSSPVEQQFYKKINNANLITAATKSTYCIIQDSIPLTEGVWAAELTAPVDSVVFNSNSDTYYKKKIEFTYDYDCKLVQQKKINDVPHSYLWDYCKQYPIAEAINADCNDIAYTSFEAEETGNWTVGSNQNTSPALRGETGNWAVGLNRDTSYALTGKRSYDISGGLSTTFIPSFTKTYILSYWSRNGSYNILGGTILTTSTGKTIDGWTYYEHELNVDDSYEGSFNITGNGLIDEVRFYPKGSQMNSFTYDPLIGKTSQSDPKGVITFYEYDNFQRLKTIKDQSGNIIKSYDYHYKQ